MVGTEKMLKGFSGLEEAIYSRKSNISVHRLSGIVAQFPYQTPLMDKCGSISGKPADPFLSTTPGQKLWNYHT